MEPFDANFFTLLKLCSASVREDIEGAFIKKILPAHEVIYEAGSVSDSVYIVVTGVVEVVTRSADHRQTRSVAYIERGDFFGDLGVLTGMPRLATVRTCEPTTVLYIEKSNFLQLLEKTPKLATFFTRNIARRLHQTSTLAHLQVFSLDLTGNLEHFDLLTIFQAITNAGRTGELYLNNADNELIGSFFFREGRVGHARFVHLLGLEAVWQGFVVSTTHGAFTFKVMAEPKETFAAEHAISLESTDLLIQGVGKRDVYQAMPPELREMRGRLQRLGQTLVWPNPDAAPQVEAERIWELTSRRPQTLDSLWRRMNYSVVTFLEAVSELVRTGQAEIQEEPEEAPVAAEPERPVFKLEPVVLPKKVANEPASTEEPITEV